jgi:hypothetical protein
MIKSAVQLKKQLSITVLNHTTDTGWFVRQRLGGGRLWHLITLAVVLDFIDSRCNAYW